MECRRNRLVLLGIKKGNMRNEHDMKRVQNYTTEAGKVCLVLARLAAMAGEDKEAAKIISEKLETFLDELQGEDFFGTEGQSDPRGDQRG